ncbi:MscS Mechanosensitive ion channel [Candidatus Vecturithrix granuli]|uniref:MscS Mechanosensitive ion channel n=1 Tax=Vecturithrix granuli TaxID=1499967 RepID=A0A081C847_VECG1|nr:MscS Mechanosensitive ion channel [Candidatus Vecturithrix granuli]
MKVSMSAFLRKTWKIPEVVWLVNVIFIFLTPPVFAQIVNSTSTALNSLTQKVNLLESLEKSLATEQENMKQFQEKLNQAQWFEKDINAEFNSYKIEITAYNSVLLAPETPVEELENIRTNIRMALEHIIARLKELHNERSAIEQARVKVKEQYTLNERQLQEIQTDRTAQDSRNPEAQAILKNLHTLTELLSEKQNILERTQMLHAAMIKKFEEIQQNFTTLAEKFSLQIEERKRRELFERRANPFSLLGWQQLEAEFDQLVHQGRQVLSKGFWNNTIQTLWKTEGFILFRFILFLAIAIFLLFRFRRFFIQLVQNIAHDAYPWRYLMLQVLQRSLLLFGITLFLYVYEQTRLAHSTITLSEVLVRILMILLFTYWMFDFLSFWERKQGEMKPVRVIFHLRFLLRVVRYFVICYVIVEWALGSVSVILLLARLLFEISLFFWSVPFWEIFRETPQRIFPGSSRTGQTLRSLSAGLGYIIASGGILIELAGFGLLARYWYLSWGRTFVVALWALIIFQVLREWDQGVTQSALEEQDTSLKAAHQLHWLTVRLSWVAWPVLLIAGLLFAWGAKEMVILGAFNLLTYSISIGGLDLSLLGLLYVLLILLFTHVATRFWQRVLQEKILINSGLDIGVQVSITTISVYLLWLFGILWALNSIGVGATSLAVAFGALGIGLGFGLQNIFNNFISGLILLFERPIEVKDVIEVNGIWGVVEKINVRSTVVRTFDNSALIIPNSDIISHQLTNWTFKDMRMRRTIEVGVAYGTETKLVEQTLYDIAEQHPRVLTDPAPMVLFSDFGESALIFKLRVWTLLDYGLTTENEIRFEIDRVFREKNITIPFPQRDLHIHSGSGNIVPASAGDHS